jgi:hypothetical protein
MTGLNRRAFITTGSAGALVLALPQRLAFAAECTSSYLPARLTVDCASRQNFQTFRKYPNYVGLACVVSTTAVAGKYGKYPAGNLFLFPWLKPRGSALGLKALYPTSQTESNTAAPVPEKAPPAEEYFCRVVLQAPWQQFIGVTVDVPFDEGRARTERFTNVDKLADGGPVGINWTTSNLNYAFFGGSRMVPSTDQCNGGSWRKLIVDGLTQASAAVCA